MAVVTNPEKTALVSLLPAADRLLEVAAAVNPALVRPGIPAHATILYPFLQSDELAGPNVERLRELAAALPATDVRLNHVVTERGFVAVGVPALQPAMESVCAAWPELIPYGGRFGPTPPVHVTIAMGASESEAERIVAELDRQLPIQARIEAMQVVALTAEGWGHCLSVPLG
jgi:hypothetical protein